MHSYEGQVISEETCCDKNFSTVLETFFIKSNCTDNSYKVNYKSGFISVFPSLNTKIKN